MTPLKYHKKYSSLLRIGVGVSLGITLSLAIVMAAISTLYLPGSDIRESLSNGWATPIVADKEITTPTDACIRVTSTRGDQLFVPTRTLPEWSAFQMYKPSGITTGPCIVIPPPVGVCGSANGRTFGTGDTGYSPYSQCGSGTPSSTAFPTIGGSGSWVCSDVGGSSPLCSASRLAPPSPVGVCGSANGRVFGAGDTGYSPYSQCGSGTPSSTAFPIAGGSGSWVCNTAGGPSPLCSASRLAPLVPPPRPVCYTPNCEDYHTYSSCTAYDASGLAIKPLPNITTRMEHIGARFIITPFRQSWKSWEWTYYGGPRLSTEYDLMEEVTCNIGVETSGTIACYANACDGRCDTSISWTVDGKTCSGLIQSNATDGAYTEAYDDSGRGGYASFTCTAGVLVERTVLSSCP